MLNLTQHLDSIKTIRGAFGPIAERKAYLLWRPINGTKMPVDPATGRPDKPNDAVSRGRMSLRLASSRWGRLEAEDAGVGIVPIRVPGLVVYDLDNCIDEAGEIAGWALPIVSASETYAEISPSGRGIHIVALDPDCEVEVFATGAKVAGVEIYGARCRRFVTLTGRILTPFPVAPASETFAAVMAHREANVTPARMVSSMMTGTGYPSGPDGTQAAVEALLSGEELHPAMLRIITARINDQRLSLGAIRAEVMDLYERSAARVSDPDRWKKRKGHVDQILEWVAKRAGPRLADIDTDDLAARKAALINATSGRWSRR